MKYETFDDLPGYLRNYCQKFGWSHEKLEEWVKEPIPALGNISILQALSYGRLQDVNNVVLRTGDALGIEGYF